jgi:hypothetical protein
VLNAGAGSSLSAPGPLVGTFGGGQVLVNGSTDPLFLFTGGSHAFGTASTAFILNGLPSETADEVVDEGGEEEEGLTLTLGTRKPLQHSGSLLEADGATLTTNRGVTIDTALVEASAPLINLRSGSRLTTAVDALDLVQKAKLTSVGPVFKLDASTLTVNNGALALVRGGSFLSVTGDFLHMRNGSTLNLLNGPLLNVSGNSAVNISGALVNFNGSGGNAINITNTLCPSGCANIGGLNVNLTGGAGIGNVSITNPIKNGALGAINLSNENTAVISVSGANSRVTITGN